MGMSAKDGIKIAFLAPTIGFKDLSDGLGHYIFCAEDNELTAKIPNAVIYKA